ncbi:MAG: PocR ligand-binding domain-containing protein [Lachnospiraceae bacterium]
MIPYIYQLIPKEELSQMLYSFQVCNALPIQLIDENGQIIISHGSETSFCTKFQAFLPPYSTCEIVHTNASRKAITLGESYIFSCHANLNHIVYPLIHNDIFLGSVLVGPFLMDDPDSTLVSDIAKHYNIPTDSLLELYDETHSISVLSPSTVTHISKLLYYLLRNVFSDDKEVYLHNQSKLLQQSKINESIQMYKSGGEKQIPQYPYDKEKLLISKVKTGDITQSKALLNDLLGYVFFSEGNSIESIKSRSLELCSLLSRAAIEGGASTNDIFIINNDFFKNVESVATLDTLCFLLQSTVEAFIESSFSHPTAPNSELIKKVIHYIGEHFSEDISLADVADYVHLNPSYLSSLFKQTTGSTFKEHLNIVRVEESKRLLLHTDYSMIDIAISCGYEDQSYFSKVFKKYTGISPKQFRE